MEKDIFGINTLANAEELQERIDLVIHKLKFFPEKPTVSCVIQINPILTNHSRIKDIINIAGGLVLDSTSWTELADQNPAIIIIMIDGDTIQDTMGEIYHLITFPNWENLAAVKNNRVYIVDSKNYFETSGERAVDALEALAEIITPKYFNFGLEGKAWVKFEI